MNKSLSKTKYVVGLSGGNDDYYNVPLNNHMDIAFDPLKTTDLYRRTGKNLGNLVWAYASRRVFAQHVEFVELSKSLIDSDGMDLIALALANIFKEGERNESLAKSMHSRLESTKIPIIVLSVGVQNKNTETFPNLGPECIKLLHLLSEKALAIGVRGDYTKSCFIHWGVSKEKIILTGCPSILLNKDAHLGKDLEMKFNNKGTIATSLPAYRLTHQLCKKLLMIASDNGSCVNVQSTTELLAAKRGELTPQEMKSLYYEIFNVDASIEQASIFFEKHVNYFNDLPNWYNCMRQFNRGISARIHGGVVMMTAGLPTVIIGVDSRVTELCEIFKIPYVTQNEFMISDVDALFEKNKIDGDAFDLNRKLIAYRFIHMLCIANAPINSELLEFAEL